MRLQLEKNKWPKAELANGEAAVNLKINDHDILTLEKGDIEAIHDYVNMLYACRNCKHGHDTDKPRYYDKEEGEWVTVPGYHVRSLEYGSYSEKVDSEGDEYMGWDKDGEGYLIYQVSGNIVRWVLSPRFDNNEYARLREWYVKAMKILSTADKTRRIVVLKDAMAGNEYLGC